MKPERPMFERIDPNAEAAADARAEADIAAGRYVDHETVKKWLRTWGTKDEHPAPKEWFE